MAVTKAAMKKKRIITIIAKMKTTMMVRTMMTMRAIAMKMTMKMKMKMKIQSVILTMERIKRKKTVVNTRVLRLRLRLPRHLAKVITLSGGDCHHLDKESRLRSERKSQCRNQK